MSGVKSRLRTLEIQIGDCYCDSNATSLHMNLKYEKKILNFKSTRNEQTSETLTDFIHIWYGGLE